jgi:hypothetical protein
VSCTAKLASLLNSSGIPAKRENVKKAELRLAVFRGERPLYPVQGAKAPPNSGNTAVGPDHVRYPPKLFAMKWEREPSWAISFRSPLLEFSTE